MKKMAASEFKTKCFAVINEVQATREAVVITKRGKPVAKLLPVSTGKGDIFGFFAGKGAIVGDVVSPAFSRKDWGKLW
jgi:prevent-host-death family protein